jgi:tetratricopeptide (TPR) repeat protein
MPVWQQPQVEGTMLFETNRRNHFCILASATLGLLATERSSVHAQLVARFTMNEATWTGPAPQVADSSGNGHNGTVIGSATTISDPMFGEVGDFASGQYVTIGGAGNIQGARSIVAWVKPQNTSSVLGLPIITGGATGAGDFFCIAGTGGEDNHGVPQRALFIDHWGEGPRNGMYSNIPVTPDIWNLVAVTFDGANTRSFYVNGAPAGTFIGQSFYNYKINTYTIGGNVIGGSTTARSFIGEMHDLQIYNTALTAAQVRTIYAAAAPEDRLREATQADPQYAPAFFMLGEFLRAKREYAQAEAAYRSYVRLRPDDYLGRNNLAWACVGRGRYVDAEAAWRTAVALAPNNPMVLANLGYALSKQGRFVEAESFYREAFRIRPNYGFGSARLEYITTLTALGKWSEAEAEYREAIQAIPNEPQLRRDFASFFVQQRKYDEAERLFGQVLVANDKDPEALRGLAEIEAKRAEAANKKETWYDAAAAYVATIDLAADGSEWRAKRKEVAREVAQWDPLFDRVVKLRPADTALWIGRAHLRLADCHWSEAAEDYAKVIDERPVGEEMCEYAGVLLLCDNKDKYNDFCSNLLKRAAVPDGQSPPAEAIRACALGPCVAIEPEKLSSWAKAATQDAKPDVRAGRLRLLGLTQYRATKFEEAVNTLREVISADVVPLPNQPPSRFDRAGLAAIVNDQRRSESWLLLAMSQFRMGNIAESKQCLATARQLIEAIQSLKPGKDHPMPPVDWLEIQLLSREAKSLIENGGA